MLNDFQDENVGHTFFVPFLLPTLMKGTSHRSL